MDRDSFIAEIEACSGMMYRVAWSILRNNADCEDALQEAALKAWEKRGHLRNEADVYKRQGGSCKSAST